MLCFDFTVFVTGFVYACEFAFSWFVGVCCIYFGLLGLGFTLTGVCVFVSFWLICVNLLVFWVWVLVGWICLGWIATFFVWFVRLWFGWGVFSVFFCLFDWKVLGLLWGYCSFGFVWFVLAVLDYFV